MNPERKLIEALREFAESLGRKLDEGPLAQIEIPCTDGSEVVPIILLANA